MDIRSSAQWCLDTPHSVTSLVNYVSVISSITNASMAHWLLRKQVDTDYLKIKKIQQIKVNDIKTGNRVIIKQVKHVFVNSNDQTVNENRKIKCVKVVNRNLTDDVNIKRFYQNK